MSTTPRPEATSQGPDDPPAVSVILPCLNEAASVGRCVEEAVHVMKAAGIPGEVVVVDNGSSDESATIAAKRGARVIDEPRPGYGSAVRAGIAAARGGIVVMADADLTYDLSRIPAMVEPIMCDEADLVVGSRFGGASRRTMPLLHRFVGTPVLSFLIGRASGHMAVEDSQSGYRAFRRELMVDLDLRASGMEFASEMLIRAVNAGLRVREVPVGYRERLGQSKLRPISDGVRHLHLILLLAPDLLLVGPGLLLAGLGTALTVFSLVQPSGLRLGSLRWQPVFFSSILLVLGTQATLAGAVIAHWSSVVTGGVRRRFRFVGRGRFPRACLAWGGLGVLAGLTVDLGLFLVWVSGGEAPTRGLALASLAQTSIIVGGSFVSFGLVSQLLLSRRVAPTVVVADASRASTPIVIMDRNGKDNRPAAEEVG